MNYYPKGGRCMSCERREHKCNHLPFREMKVHRTDGTDAVVICSYFSRAPQEDSRAK